MLANPDKDAAASGILELLLVIEGREANAFMMVCRGIESIDTAVLRRRETDFDARNCRKEAVDGDAEEVAEGRGKVVS